MHDKAYPHTPASLGGAPPRRWSTRAARWFLALALTCAASAMPRPVLADERTKVHVYGMALGTTSPIGQRTVEVVNKAASTTLDATVLPNSYVLSESRIVDQLLNDPVPSLVVVSALGATSALVGDEDAVRALRKLETPSCFMKSPLERATLVEFAKLADETISRSLKVDKPLTAAFGGIIAAVDLGPVLLLSKKSVSTRDDLAGMTMGIFDRDPVARDAFTSVGLGVALADLSIVRLLLHRDRYQALYMPRAVLQELRLDEPVLGTDYKAVTEYLPHAYVANRAVGFVIQNRAAREASPEVREALRKLAWSLSEGVSGLFYAASAKSQPKDLPPALAGDVAKWDETWSRACVRCRADWHGLIKRVCRTP